MTNLLQRGASFLSSKLKSLAVAGREIVYHRGALRSEVINAWCSEHEYPITDNDGFVTSVIAYDWSFNTADLLIRGAAVKPASGDRIIEVLNGDEIIYEVMPIDNGHEKSESDTSGLITRVHTKRVA